MSLIPMFEEKTPLEFLKINYFYRDASNYKFWGSTSVAGDFSLKHVSSFLISSEYFIPQTVGLRCLVPSQQNDDDHALHELADIIPTDRVDDFLLAPVLIDRFRQAARRGWFIA